MQATTDWSKSVRVEVGGDDVWPGHAGENVIPAAMFGRRDRPETQRLVGRVLSRA